MKVGYIRVSTEEQNTARQEVLMEQLGVERIYIDKLSGKSKERPQFRTCLHKKCMRIFVHDFVADKAKIRRRAAARQGFLTQYAAKFAEKTCAYAYEDRF